MKKYASGEEINANAENDFKSFYNKWEGKKEKYPTWWGSTVKEGFENADAKKVGTINREETSNKLDILKMKVANMRK